MEPGEDETTKASVQNRLDAAETKIGTLDRGLTEVWWAIGVLAVVPMIIWLAVGLWPAAEPEPTNHDSTVDQLLSEDVHCYDSAEERAAARQRALAAIDRIKWERDHQEPAEGLLSAPGPPPAKLPSVRDTPVEGESWDGKRCFQVSYDFFG